MSISGCPTSQCGEDNRTPPDRGIPKTNPRVLKRNVEPGLIILVSLYTEDWSRQIIIVWNSSKLVTMTDLIPTSTPTLEEKHSGVPPRLVEQAKRAKDLLQSRRTASKASTSQQRSLHLPPYTSRQKFDEAIAKLKEAVGDEFVHINDQPLVDGWYMEHP